MSQSLLHQAPGTAPMEALLCYELEPYQEFLLCFSKFGIYISYDGKRARQSEIMWPSQVCFLHTKFSLKISLSIFKWISCVL